MKSINLLNGIIHTVRREKRKIAAIKSDEENRKKNQRYGVNSLVLSLLMVVSSCTIFLTSNLGNALADVISFLLFLILVVTSYVLPSVFAIYSFSYAIIQLRINRKIIGWFALLGFFLALVPTIVIIANNPFIE